MDCKKLTNLIPEFIEGTLPEELKQDVQVHISSCSDCSVLLQKYKATMLLLKPVKEIPEQAFYYTRLKQKMENRFNKEPLLNNMLLKKLLQPAIYFASLVIAVYIGILIGSSSGNFATNEFSNVKEDNKDYVQAFAEYQYLNDFEIEPIENLFKEDSIKNK